MLVAVIMMFIVLSYTGVAVLDISYNSRSISMETVENVKVQYLVETTVNKTLWRINSGVDSLINITEGGICTSWNDTSQVLTVTLDTLNTQTEIDLDLSQDTHFNRALASNETIVTNGYDSEIDAENRSRLFTFLPVVDMDYYMDNAVAIHTESFHKWEGGKGKGKSKGKGKADESDGDLVEGIHVFTGSFLEMKKLNLTNHTLVFTGEYIFFNDKNNIDAPVPADSADALPALVFTNPKNFFEVEAEGKKYNKEDVINGAIYTAGTIVLKKGELSGPIVGNVIRLEEGEDFVNEIKFNDTEYPEYYRWTKGFKNKEDYDWPKQIGRWKTKKWKRSNQSH